MGQELPTSSLEITQAGYEKKKKMVMKEKIMITMMII